MQFGKVQGKGRSIVITERVVLNLMQRMSGIATPTKAMADAACPAYILETRKTAPGLRLVDKWAVLLSGGQNHRMGLFDMMMIKDNHISAAGGVSKALQSVDQYFEQNKLQMGVEVKTRTLAEVCEVLEYASQTKTALTRIMLDNMVIPLSNWDLEVSMLKEAVDLINGKFETEASGNVTLETVHKIGQSGVTHISRFKRVEAAELQKVNKNHCTNVKIKVVMKIAMAKYVLRGSMFLCICGCERPSTPKTPLCTVRYLINLVIGI